MGRGMKLGAEALVKRYGKQTVLDVERVEVRAGRTLAVLGPSGAGKTTLLSLLGLLEKPDGGQVYLEDRPVGVKDRDARMHMAAAFQSPFLFRGTVEDNVAYGLEIRRVRAAERRERVAAVLARVGLEGWERRGIATLSGGEAQRVALARALVLEPSVLFLDEPLASLDPLSKGRMIADFSRIIREDGVTTIYVTHDQAEAMSMADDVIVLREGKAAALGEAAEVMGLPPDEWTAAFLGAGTPLGGSVVAGESNLLSIDVGGPRITALGDLPEATRVVVGIRPEDVLLFEGDVEIPRSTARNRLAATIVGLRRWGLGYHLILDLGGAHIAASITHSSAKEMNLEVGTKVQAVFKATAVRIKRASSDEENASGLPSKAVGTNMGAGD